MVEEMAEVSETTRKLRQIQKDLRIIGLKRYLLIALEYDGFDKASISILRRWRGLTEARIAQVVNLLVELGHLVKLIAFQRNETVSSVPILLNEAPEVTIESGFATGLITCSLYKDDYVTIGEVPVTSTLYNSGIRKPLVYICTSNIHRNLVMGLLGKPPLRETIPQLKAVLNDFLVLFEAESLERKDFQMVPMLLKGGNDGEKC